MVILDHRGIELNEPNLSPMNNPKGYDVIIIGAGPAGLACAEQIIGSGMSLLIIEKNKTIGPKICAGGLTGLTSGFEVPQQKTRKFTHQKLMVRNSSFNVKLATPHRTISRKELGAFQLKKLSEASNIDIMTGLRVEGIKQRNIVIDQEKEVGFRFLVGADGSNSAVRKYLKLKTEFYLGLYYEIPRITDDYVFYFDPKSMGSGYLWIFPHQELTNVGIYYNPQQLTTPEAKAILTGFLTKQFPNDPVLKMKGATLPYHYEGYCFNNIFLAGDAAGLCLRSTGEGISGALISGYEIGKKIVDPTYKTKEINRFLHIKNRDEQWFKFFESFPFLRHDLLKFYFLLRKNKAIQRYFNG